MLRISPLGPPETVRKRRSVPHGRYKKGLLPHMKWLSHMVNIAHGITVCGGISVISNSPFKRIKGWRSMRINIIVWAWESQTEEPIYRGDLNRLSILRCHTVKSGHLRQR